MEQNLKDLAGFLEEEGERLGKDRIRGMLVPSASQILKEKLPVLVIGGRAGSFLGEYQAGGNIVVLGNGAQPVVGNFCGTGMHGGQILLRCDEVPPLPAQVKAERVHGPCDEESAELIREWCRKFGRDEREYMNAVYYRLTPNTENPYRQMYTAN